MEYTLVFAENNSRTRNRTIRFIGEQSSIAQCRQALHLVMKHLPREVGILWAVACVNGEISEVLYGHVDTNEWQINCHPTAA